MLLSENKSRHSKFYFCFLCCLVYFTSYLTRIDYSAVLVEIIDDLNISKELASIAVTGSFITYGLGQLVSGFLGDHIAPRRMIAMGLCATSVVNILMSVLPNIYVMTVFWCFNGFFQAMLWPPLVRIMAENMDDAFYAKASVLVSAAASAATIFVRSLLAPVTILAAGWRPVFIIAGCVGFLVVFLWYTGTRSIAGSNREKPNVGSASDTPAVSLRILAASGAFIAMAGIILQGILRDGIDTWMPTYIREVFNLGSSASILSSSILPIFSIFSVSVASVLHKKIGNELKTSALLFAVAMAASLAILPVFSSSILLSALLMAVITGCMHGINLMLISRLPVAFKRYGKVSTISGILNACTYVGSALSTYGFARFSELYGWYFIIVTWAVVAALGAIVCGCCIRRWQRFTEQK